MWQHTCWDRLFWSALQLIDGIYTWHVWSGPAVVRSYASSAVMRIDARRLAGLHLCYIVGYEISDKIFSSYITGICQSLHIMQ